MRCPPQYLAAHEGLEVSQGDLRLHLEGRVFQRSPHQGRLFQRPRPERLNHLQVEVAPLLP